ncbi:MAG: hypothetical protein EZS28_049066, partial [Streblomastix strix]
DPELTCYDDEPEDIDLLSPYLFI